MKRLLFACFLASVTLVYASPLLFGQTPARTVTRPTGPPTTAVPGTVATAQPGQPATTAVPVTSVPSPAAPSNLGDSVIWGLIVSQFLKFLKKNDRFKWLTPESPERLQAIIGFVAATTTAVGIHVVVNGSFFSHEGIAFSATGLSFDAFKDIVFQWGFQQGWTDLLKEKTV